MNRIVILATLDTKGEETAYLKGLIEKNGCMALIADCSLRAGGGRNADIQVEELIGDIGMSEAVFAALDKDGAIACMQKALCYRLSHMQREGQLDGVISVGGVQGTVIATAAMKLLPVGVPKYMVSTVANGNATFGPFVGVSDMAIMHSVVDISGLNYVLRKVLAEAAGAICGMVKARVSETSPGNVVGITMAGVTTPCVTMLKKGLEQRGYEVLIFHCNGVGAHVMENLVAEQEISYVIDFSPHDIMDGLEAGLMPCYEDRLRPIAKAGVPLLFVPGSMDFILYNGVDKVPEDKKSRAFYKHNPIHTHVRASYEELYAAGRFVAERLQGIHAQACVLIPQRGFSQMNSPGNALYDPAADQGFADAMEAFAPKGLRVHKVDAHINNEAFAAYCLRIFDQLAAECEKRPVAVSQ